MKIIFILCLLGIAFYGFIVTKLVMWGLSEINYWLSNIRWRLSQRSLKKKWKA